jgi:biopolymer transport protein ExbD
MRYFEVRKARIEIIPMIDIIFFLLVFFVMITVRMIPADGLATQLPQSTTARELPRPQVVISMAGDTDIRVDDHAVALPDLEKTLAALPDPAQAQVTIAGARTVSLQGIMAVMDACRAAGITQIGLAARGAP